MSEDEKLKRIAADLAGDGSKPEDYELVHVATTRHRQQLPTGQEILDKLDDMIDEQQAHIKRFEGAPLTPIGATAIVHALLQLKEWIVLEPKPEANTEQAGQTDEQG